VGDHVTIKNDPTTDCVHKSVVTQLIPMLALPENYVCSAYTGCIANERVALSKRHGIQLPEVNDDRLLDLQKFYFEYRKVPPIEPMTWDELIADVPSNRRNKVRLARQFVEEGWSTRFSQVKAFIKFEKWEACSVMSENLKPMIDNCPRLIQFREPAYTYELARYLRAVEKKFFNTAPNGEWLPVKWRHFSKGMTSWQIGNNLATKWNALKDPVAVLLDYHRMDAHMRKRLRDLIEWEYYRRSNPSKWLKFLLSLQEKNRVTSMHMLIWIIVATMMSGEYNTSLGDNEVNDAITAEIMQWIDHFKLIAGDDGVLLMEKSDLEMLDMHFSDFGMIAKIEIVYSLHDVSFCQCKPLRIAGRWRMVRDPWRVMSRTSYTCKKMNGLGWKRLLGSIGLGELSCNTGVPVLQSYASMLYRSADHMVSNALVKEYMLMRPDAITSRLLPVTDEARIDFWCAFGMTPVEQKELEGLFDSIEIPCLPLG